MWSYQSKKSPLTGIVLMCSPQKTPKPNVSRMLLNVGKDRCQHAKAQRSPVTYFYVSVTEVDKT